MTTALARARNRFLAVTATRVLIAHAEPGSSTEALARLCEAAGKSVEFLDQ